MDKNDTRERKRERERDGERDGESDGEKEREIHAPNHLWSISGFALPSMHPNNSLLL